jgi:hypothetical protein
MIYGVWPWRVHLLHRVVRGTAEADRVEVVL